MKITVKIGKVKICLERPEYYDPSKSSNFKERETIMLDTLTSMVNKAKELYPLQKDEI